MRRRLFLKIYLTFLGGILALVLTGLTAGALLTGAEGRGAWESKRDALLGAVLPADLTPAETQAVLDRFGAALEAELVLIGSDGRRLAAYLPPAPEPDARARRWQPDAMALPDGRRLLVRLPGGGFGGPPGGPLFLLAAFAGLLALAAWPAARHLTGRLERLRQGVALWGEGDLSRRAPVEGSDEIAAVAASFNRAAARVEALVAANRALLANASHELRSPLARLRMALDLHEADPGPARREEILRNLAELDDLVEEILLSSRLSHAALSAPTQRLDLLALAAEEAARFGLEVEGDSVEIAGEPRLIARLLRNLLHNAERHGAPPIEIRVGRRAGFAELSVRDHGPGVGAEEGERLFEPFHRPKGFGEAAGGWGLGLALVRQIAERHGGSARHEAPPGGGARFLVRLPEAGD